MLTGKDNEPYAQRTDLGWSIVGRTTPRLNLENVTALSHRITTRGRVHRCDVQKSTVRVFGDRSEPVSSSEKGYLYNCRKDVARWERPKEWVEAKAFESRSREKDLARSVMAKGVVYNEHQKHSASGSRVGTTSRLVSEMQGLSSHTDNNHRQSAAYDRQQKLGTANINEAAASKPYARDNTPRKTVRHMKYAVSHVTTASAMTADRVSMNNSSTSKHVRARDTHEHRSKAKRDGNTTLETTRRSMYGRTRGFGDGKGRVALPPPGHFMKEDVFPRKRWRRIRFLADQSWSR